MESRQIFQKMIEKIQEKKILQKITRRRRVRERTDAAIVLQNSISESHPKLCSKDTRKILERYSKDAQTITNDKYKKIWHGTE